MRRLRGWCVRLAATFSGAGREGELSEELDSHLQLHVDAGTRAGLNPQEARRQAILALGGLEQTKER